MARTPMWRRYLRFWGSDVRADVDAELDFHMRELTERLAREGRDPVEAGAEAARRFGDYARVEAACVEIDQGWERQRRWCQFVADLWQDLRHSLRSLRRSPGLVVVGALSLGLGIGLNALLYMGVSTIYGHEPTMREPNRVVGVDPGNANRFSYPDYRDLLRSRIFEDALGFRITGMNLGSDGRATAVPVMAVTANFFDVLGVDALVGRTFSDDAAPEREPRVVVVTSGFWRASLGGDPAAIGEPLLLDGEPFNLIGVLPDDYRSVAGWQSPHLYVPVSRWTVPTIDERRSPSLSVLARLVPNTAAPQAQRALGDLIASLDRAWPERMESRRRPATVFPATTLQFRGVPAQFWLLGAVAGVTAGLVLLIACLNVAGLLVARATHRRRETAIRIAIGAGRFRLVRAMLADSFLLVAAGTAVALPLAFVLNQIPFPGIMAGLQEALAPDRRLLPVGVILVGLATLVCGIVPALRATRGDVVPALGQSGASVTPPLRLRQALVAAQVAMSLVLIVAALLCVRSQIEIARVDLGFRIDQGVVARFGLDPGQYPGQARVRLAERLVDRIGGMTGVASVSVADFVPLGGNVLVRSFHPAGRTDLPGSRPDTFSVGPGYFRTLGIPLLKGRDFETSDRAGTPVVAIVNETFARTHFPGQDVVGQRVQTADEADAQVVGLVRDHRIGTIGETPPSVIYYAFAQRPSRLFLHVRSTASPAAMASAVRRAIGEVDASAPAGVQTLRAAASLELTMRRVGMLLMGAMGGLGLVLALIGLYGVMAYLTASRTTEVGLRMALGATRRRIRREMLQRAFMVVAPGVALGMIASLVLMPALSTFLAGVSPFDPVAFGGAATILLLSGLAAGYGPARRSARRDPIRALREL